MSVEVEFFYDVVSPYSYLAATQIEGIVADCGATVRFRPFFLGGLMKAVGNQPPANLRPRGRYMFTDLQRWADYYGVPYSFPSRFPMMTLAAQRGLMAFEGEELKARTHALFRAYWAEDRDINDKDVLVDVLGADAVAHSKTAAAKHGLIDATTEAEQRGAFGAPTLFIGEEMWFGNDRLPFLEQRLRELVATAQ